MIIFIYTTLIFLYLLSVFAYIPGLNYVIGAMAVLALIMSSVRARGLYFISGICFLAGAIFLFLFSSKPWYSILDHFDSMLGMLSLFLFLPFLNSIVRVGHYDTNLNSLLRKNVVQVSHLYKRSFLVSHLLGVFLNIATIPLLRNSLNPTLNQLPPNTANKFLSQSLLRAYALCLTWSPMEVMVSTALDITGTNYYQIILPIVLIVIIIAGFDWAISKFTYRHSSLSFPKAEQVAGAKIRKKLLEMMFMLLVIVTLASLIQHFFQKGFLVSIVLLIIPVSFLWAFIIKKPKMYLTYTIPHWKERTRGLSNYFFMFLCAGLFVKLLSLSGKLSFLQDAFRQISDQTLLFYLMIGCYFLVTSLIGFHPLVSITLLAELMAPVLPEVSSPSLTIVLITCSLATVMYSPFNLSLSILADLIKLNPFKITYWNIKFSIFYMIFGIMIAYSIHSFL
ncbi:hypothetical protein BGM26_06820 [Bacillus sp. FJAT-29790]|uniref:hypothetical protein n=1 Tax=Bacillus sp. FJAT-29790 TaxID=1895002 RepID=UPI001C22B04E|nr:hypothetical protein [Bacillus sp. FJAT-29790]MBU8878701.1 hypothetical protein [Bacillus sp. FJAT-29790]